MTSHFRDPWSGSHDRRPYLFDEDRFDGNESLTLTPDSGAEDPLAEQGVALSSTPSAIAKAAARAMMPFRTSTPKTDPGTEYRRWGGEKTVLLQLKSKLRRIFNIGHRSCGSPGDDRSQGKVQRFNRPSASEPQLDHMLDSGRYDGGSSLNTSRLPSAVDHVINMALGSAYSMSDSGFSHASSAMEAAFSLKKLLELSDDVRESIIDQGRLASSPQLMQQLVLFIETALSEENRDVPSIDFDTIKTAHLDRLLVEIIDHANNVGLQSAKTFSYVTTAKALQRAWRKRFKSEYFKIDEIRILELASCGRLREISFITPTQLTPTPNAWKASDIDAFSDIDGNSQFQVGQWWLNIACAHRDGIVGSELEKPTRGKYDNSALPLLTGKEDIVKNGEVANYTREGTLADMHPALLSQTGKQIRILRGFQLKSSYAPSAGVRYDGLWKLASYRQHLDLSNNIYHLQITLERVNGQAPMKEILKIPKPSQLDDWRLYEKLEQDKIRQSTGERGAYDWRLQHEEERRDREESRRIREFRSSIGAGPIRPMSGTTSTASTFHPPITVPAPPAQRGIMKLRLPPAIQAKVDKAERDATVKSEATVKKAVIDTSRNQEYHSKIRDGDSHNSDEAAS